MIRQHLLKKEGTKHNAQEQFDGEISEAIKNHDYQKNLKNSYKEFETLNWLTMTETIANCF